MAKKGKSKSSARTPLQIRMPDEVRDRLEAAKEQDNFEKLATWGLWAMKLRADEVLGTQQTVKQLLQSLIDADLMSEQPPHIKECARSLLGWDES